MNAFQTCSNTSDLVPLYLPQQLYLKPIARVNISLQLPNVKKLGKSVSHWEIMDKIRGLIKPDEFTVLKVTKTTVEFVRFEGEIETRDKLERVLSKIDNKMIKLKDFSDLMRIRAAEWKSEFPNRRIWDDFFSNARDMDEMKPGERPDTIYLSHLPSKWFVPYHLTDEEDITPSEKIFYRVFEKFGSIRFVDIPICDPYRKKMKDHISGLKNSSFDKTDFFEGYVQFKDYIGFVKAMDAFRNMKLVHKEDDGAVEVNIKVDFDKSKHLSDASIRRREIVRDRLVKKNREKEERERAELEEKKRKEEIERQKEVDIKEQKKLRRKLREEKRKAKILEKLEIAGSDEINDKIAKEEKKLLKVQRKLEAIRLVEELFRRIKEKNPDNIQHYNIPNSNYDELKRYKNTSELEVLTQREKLHHVLKGRVMLKSILSDGQRPRRYSSSSSNSEFSIEEEPKQRPKSPVMEKYPELLYDPSWMGFQYQIPPTHIYGVNPYAAMRGFHPRGRPFPRLPGIPGPSRGGYNRRRGNFQPRFRGGYRGPNPRQYPHDQDEEYEKYISKFLHEHDDRIYVERKRSYSPRGRSRRSRSRSDSRRRSYSRSRSRSRSRSFRSRSHSRRPRSRTHRSRSHSRRSRSRSHRSHSRSHRSHSRSHRSHSRSHRSHSRSHRSKSRSKSRGKSRKSHSRERRRSRSKSKKSPERSRRSISRSRDEKNSRRTGSPSKEKSQKSLSSRSRDKSQKNKETSRSRDGSRSREKSVDSSTFLTPKQLLQQRSDRRDRSKSWSLPKEDDKSRSWSKSPEKK